MANEFVRNFMQQQRQRLVGSIMGYAEQNLYKKMTREEQIAYREKVLQSVTIYHDNVLDILKSSVNDGTVLNEEAVRLLTLLLAKAEDN